MRSRHNSTITGSTLSSITWCSATSCSTGSRASAANSFQSVGQLVAVTWGAYRSSRASHAVPGAIYGRRSTTAGLVRAAIQPGPAAITLATMSAPKNVAASTSAGTTG